MLCTILKTVDLPKDGKPTVFIEFGCESKKIEKACQKKMDQGQKADYAGFFFRKRFKGTNKKGYGIRGV